MSARVLLAALAAAGCALIGRACAMRCTRRADLLSALPQALLLLRIQMLDRATPTRKALGRSACALFRELAAHMEDKDAAQAWREVRLQETCRGGRLDCLQREDLAVLEDFFGGLGLSGRSEQEALFDAAIRAMTALGDEARKGGAEKNRLYTTLGLLVGLILAILLL